MEHLPMIIIVSRYNLDRKSSMENPHWREWVTTSLCDNPRRFIPKESVLDLRDLIVI